MARAASTATNTSRIALIVLACSLLAPVTARAGHVNLAWDPNPESFVAGYVVYYGTEPGVYDWSVDVGNTTTYTVNSLTNDVTYYFVVRAHSVDFLFSDPSNEVSGIPTNSAPSVLNPGDITMKAGPLVLSISASDPDFDELTYTATGLPSGLAIDAASGDQRRRASRYAFTIHDARRASLP